jgi:transposase InsO family protein
MGLALIGLRNHRPVSPRPLHGGLSSIEWRGRPDRIRCDNGPEYVSAALMAWAYRRGIRVEFIQPGKPQQNAYIERYNRTVRYDWLAHYCSTALTKFRTTLPAGSGPIITNAPTWPSVASHPTRNWPWPHSLYSQTASKMGKLPCLLCSEYGVLYLKKALEECSALSCAQLR